MAEYIRLRPKPPLSSSHVRFRVLFPVSLFSLSLALTLNQFPLSFSPSILVRYVSLTVTPVNDHMLLQLAAYVALLIASKMGETCPLRMRSLANLTGRMFTPLQVLLFFSAFAEQVAARRLKPWTRPPCASARYLRSSSSSLARAPLLGRPFNLSGMCR